MDAVMTVVADHREFVDIGFASDRSVPRLEVVGFAAAMIKAAQHTATVPDNQGEPLAPGDRSLRAALPKHLADVGHQLCCLIGYASVVLGHGNREPTQADQFTFPFQLTVRVVRDVAELAGEHHDRPST
jgi:hypothetical protein